MKAFTTTVLAIAASAASADVTFDPTNLEFTSDARIEARFKADTTNWDSRLEFDSFPNNGDTTGHVANGRSNFENQTFSFELFFQADTSVVSWTITRPDTTSNTISQTVSGFGSLNTIHMFTNGSAGSTSLSNLSFNGLGESLTNTDFPSLNTSPDTSTFAESFLYFGDSANLLASDWSLAGNISFGDFNRNNPNERNKITIKLREGVIPAPSTAALAALGGLLATRRRR